MTYVSLNKLSMQWENRLNTKVYMVPKHVSNLIARSSKSLVSEGKRNLKKK